MKKPYFVFLLFSLIFSCQSQKEEQGLKTESKWFNSFIGFNDHIQDSAVNGDELHILTNKYFYKIKGNTILEKRPLTQSSYNNYGATIGSQFIFRAFHLDSTQWLEFIPIKEGGEPFLINARNLGDDIIVPDNIAGGLGQPGIFNSKNQLLLIAANYTQQQSLFIEFDIQYDENSNIIESVDVVHMENINPQSHSGAERIDMLQIDNEVFYFGAYGDNLYRYENHTLKHSSDFRLRSIFREGGDLFATTVSGLILTTTDNGLNWQETGQVLEQGNYLEKIGEYFTTSKRSHPFLVGRSFNTLKVLNQEGLGDDPIFPSMVEFFDNQYYISTNNKIYSRESLE